MPVAVRTNIIDAIMDYSYKYISSTECMVRCYIGESDVKKLTLCLTRVPATGPVILCLLSRQREKRTGPGRLGLGARARARARS